MDSDGTTVAAGHCENCGTGALLCEECDEVSGLDTGRTGEQRCDWCDADYEVLQERKGMFEGVRHLRTDQGD